MFCQHERQTLAAVFAKPTRVIAWKDIEVLLVACGCRVIEGNGSRVKFVNKGVIATFHRPHPEKDARKYQVEDARQFLEQMAVKPRKNVLEYEGHRARADFDGDDDCSVGHIVGINDIVGFHGSTVDEMKAAFKEAVDDYLDTCRRVGKSPERTYSAAMMFRVSPETHASSAQLADLRGLSLNQLGEEVMRQVTAEARAGKRKKPATTDLDNSRKKIWVTIPRTGALKSVTHRHKAEIASWRGMSRCMRF